MWKNTIIRLGDRIQDAAVNLGDSGLQICLVADQSNCLLGTVTDGDIRRALLKGLGLDAVVSEVMNKDPIVVAGNADPELVKQLMLDSQIKQIPIVNEQRELIGLHLWNDIGGVRPIVSPMVIMAGGRGTRLAPLTDECPKPMLKIGGKPMLEQIICKARAEGFQNFYISVNYMGDVIENHFGDGSRFGVNIEYLRETSRLGTAGSLALLAHESDEPIVVTNGDVITNVKYKDLIEFHQSQKAHATLAIREHLSQCQFGVVRLSEFEVLEIEEKPIRHDYINAGIYVLTKRILDTINPNSPIDMPELIAQAKNNSSKVVGYLVFEPWFDVGRVEDLVNADKFTQSQFGAKWN